MFVFIYADEVAMFSPNLPAYGGLVALAGERAYMCVMSSDLVQSIEEFESHEFGVYDKLSSFKSIV